MTEAEYKKELKGRIIKYRSSLDLPKEITFGVEIEYENIVTDTVSYLFLEEECYNEKFRGWINKKELDLAELNKLNESMNGEINSPILTDQITSWKNLKTSLEILYKNDARITEKCGGHVNIGAHILGRNPNYWRNFFLLWILYEKEIYEFCSGEYDKVRQRKDYMSRIALKLKKNIDIILNDSDKIYEYLESVSPQLFYKTYDIFVTEQISSTQKNNNIIEFRLPNGTLKEEIWQNYINFFAKFILACKKELDMEKVLYKIENNNHNSVELADYIFTAEIDKTNFLIQTLKTNKIYKKELEHHIIY